MIENSSGFTNVRGLGETRWRTAGDSTAKALNVNTCCSGS